MLATFDHSKKLDRGDNMITPELIARINELARKQREGTLTAAEKEEQAKVRRIYIDCVKNQVRAYLEEQGHSPDCDCGCNHKH